MWGGAGAIAARRAADTELVWALEPEPVVPGRGQRPGVSGKAIEPGVRSACDPQLALAHCARAVSTAAAGATGAGLRPLAHPQCGPGLQCQVRSALGAATSARCAVLQSPQVYHGCCWKYQQSDSESEQPTHLTARSRWRRYSSPDSMRQRPWMTATRAFCWECRPPLLALALAPPSAESSSGTQSKRSGLLARPGRRGAG